MAGAAAGAAEEERAGGTDVAVAAIDESALAWEATTELTWLWSAADSSGDTVLGVCSGVAGQSAGGGVAVVQHMSARHLVHSSESCACALL